MTECERLISEGKLDPAFLEAETRCEYPVDTATKKLWAMQIDLVKQAQEICKRHGLTLFVIGGGCIGAIRHKGCIPWDDDIDIALKREDYNIFMEKAREELKAPYFLQTTETDPYFFRSFIALRNSNGTCIARGDRTIPCNNGIVVHVFPLDGYEDNFRCRLFRFFTFYKSIYLMKTNHADSARRHRLLRRLMRPLRFIIFPHGVKTYFRKFNEKCTRLSKKYKNRIGIQYAHITKAHSTNNPWTWDASLFDEAINVPFEYTVIPIPKGYDEFLTVTYGDYMKFPPIEKRGEKHEFEYDPDIPYQIYCHTKYGVKYNSDPSVR